MKRTILISILVTQLFFLSSCAPEVKQTREEIITSEMAKFHYNTIEDRKDQFYYIVGTTSTNKRVYHNELKKFLNYELSTTRKNDGLNEFKSKILYLTDSELRRIVDDLVDKLYLDVLEGEESKRFTILYNDSLRNVHYDIDTNVLHCNLKTLRTSTYEMVNLYAVITQGVLFETEYNELKFDDNIDKENNFLIKEAVQRTENPFN